MTMMLEKRIQRLEDIEAVKALIAKAGRWFDRYSLTGSREDAAAAYDSLFVPGGYYEFAWGTWGPDRKQMIEAIYDFVKTVDWSLHFFVNEEVELNDDLSKAVYHSFMIVPIETDGVALWRFGELEVEVVKVNNEWNIKRYKVLDLKSVENSASSWPKFQKNDSSWMFSGPPKLG
jgi:hypothetical protein